MLAEFAAGAAFARAWLAQRRARAAGPDPAPRLYASWRDVVPSWDAKRWPNFTPAELACNCSGQFCERAYFHDCDFLDRLQAMRTAVGKPFVINSAHRCPKWNAICGGAPRSTHKMIAADVSLRGHDPAQLYAEARKAGFRGFGFGSTFLHLDTRASPAFWGYGQGSVRTWSGFGVLFDDTGRRVRALPAEIGLKRG
jgi:hypothetical protein